MTITSAQYTKSRSGNIRNIRATIDGVVSDVPMVEDNRHYAEILRQVAAGELTIADAD
tara:strand:+ start:494 stop:667 length:174 start_codon:yes stop_codon:yes gene_type:complete